MQLKVGLHLHASGTRRHFIELFHNMRVCCSYDVILNNIREISRIASKQIVAIGKHANTITAYDNFEYTMGVQQQHVDDKSTFHSVTTGLAFNGQYIPPNGLSQRMHNPSFELDVQKLFQTDAFIADEIDFSGI